ncbi:C10 family peptidase [Desulfogranum japonicum]|uniref:C10 family peptidase n=1 Tax=Desulfogranum japonicum TaxID=231447 RepID=UPI0003FED7D9|nr:C10 family peptidase [Desulfogranum japonicum]
MSRLVFRLFLGSIVSLLLLGQVIAAEVDRARATLVAQKYLHYVHTTFNRWKEAEPALASVEPVIYEEVTVFWLAKVDPAGYLLISARDELSPVKLYSDTGYFLPSRVTIAGAPESWLIPRQYKAIQVISNIATMKMAAGTDSVANQIGDAWNMFGQDSAVRKSAVAKTATVGPLIQALWTQESPYNAQLPEIDGKNVLVGCVATAWSMLLRHWQWPDTGTGTHTHIWNGETFTVDLSKESYDWDNMPDTLTASSTEAQKNAVAKLCYQVGVTADMDWGLYSSGSNLYADQILDIYFKYKSSMQQVARSDTDAATWFSLFQTEFDASPARPIVMSVFSSSGGHEILADGYQTDSTNKVHLNMGWAGAYNGWYDVTDDFAANYNWIGNESVIVIGIEPDYGTQTYTVASSVDKNNSYGSITPSGTQTITYGQTATFTLAPENGYVVSEVTGTCGGSLDAAKILFTTDTITADCTVIVHFSQTNNKSDILFQILPVILRAAQQQSK